jgi:hypothetical protein
MYNSSSTSDVNHESLQLIREMIREMNLEKSHQKSLSMSVELNF